MAIALPCLSFFNFRWRESIAREHLEDSAWWVRETLWITNYSSIRNKIIYFIWGCQERSSDEGKLHKRSITFKIFIFARIITYDVKPTKFTCQIARVWCVIRWIVKPIKLYVLNRVPSWILNLSIEECKLKKKNEIKFSNVNVIPSPWHEQFIEFSKKTLWPPIIKNPEKKSIET